MERLGEVRAIVLVDEINFLDSRIDVRRKRKWIVKLEQEAKHAVEQLTITDGTRVVIRPLS